MTPTDEARIEEAARAMLPLVNADMDPGMRDAWLNDLARAALAPTLAELADMTAKVERLEVEVVRMRAQAALYGVTSHPGEVAGEAQMVGSAGDTQALECRPTPLARIPA